MIKQIAIYVMVLVFVCIKSEETNQIKKAYCEFVAEKDSGVTGYVTYTQASATDSLMMHVEIKGLTPNTKRGFHVHEKGDMTNGCTSQGSHYNPMVQNHGGQNDSVRHLGDLGNVQVDSNGNVSVDIVDSKLSLFGDYSIIGRGCSVHSAEDDLGDGGNEESLKSGNSGHSLACGEIKEGTMSGSLIQTISIILIFILN